MEKRQTWKRQAAVLAAVAAGVLGIGFACARMPDPMIERAHAALREELHDPGIRFEGPDYVGSRGDWVGVYGNCLLGSSVPGGTERENAIYGVDFQRSGSDWVVTRAWAYRSADRAKEVPVAP